MKRGGPSPEGDPKVLRPCEPDPPPWTRVSTAILAQRLGIQDDMGTSSDENWLDPDLHAEISQAECAAYRERAESRMRSAVRLAAASERVSIMCNRAQPTRPMYFVGAGHRLRDSAPGSSSVLGTATATED